VYPVCVLLDELSELLVEPGRVLGPRDIDAGLQMDCRLKGECGAMMSVVDNDDIAVSAGLVRRGEEGETPERAQPVSMPYHFQLSVRSFRISSPANLCSASQARALAPRA
jgi:hypothetical protein